AGNAARHGEEFWASDGWSTTRLVDDIAVGVGNANPLFFTAAGGSVFFHANDNRTGRELWAIRKAALVHALHVVDSTDDVEDDQGSVRRSHGQMGRCCETLSPEQFFADSPDRERAAWLGSEFE